jgi:GNAT superfamily N-acetyltransferase
MGAMPTPVPFTQDHLDAAVALFVDGYQGEREYSPLLPRRAIDEPAWIRGALQSALGHPGAAIVEQGRLLGYMLSGERFAWKGQQAVIVHEYGHAAVAAGRAELYQRLYMALGQMWADRGIHLHLVRHFAHDAVLQETLYQLGFGAILAERLRDCSALAGTPEAAVRIETDMGRLVALHAEHNAYYPRSPIFISKPTDDRAVRAELDAHGRQGDVIFVCDEQGEPCAYMIAGQSAIGAEGFLLERTNTAQVKSAYARPAVRGSGLGGALLQRAIAWSRQQGYERLFVEHETANVHGGAFWRRHFTPFVHVSMRYIDPTLASADRS